MAKPKLPRYIVILNIIMVVLILVICALAFSLAYSALKPEESAPESTVQTEETEQTAETVEQVTTAATTTTRISVSMTKRTTEPIVTLPPDTEKQDITSEPAEQTGESSDAPTEEAQQTFTRYDKSFFENDLFIGDSISTGLYLYGKLDGKNVAASVGYTPYKAYTSEVELYDGTTRTALEYAEAMQPKRIFVMLGSNGMASSGDMSAMEDTYSTLLDKLAKACPASEICCLSVSPVTADSSAAASGGITNETIKSFNAYIEKLCGEKKLRYFDIYSLLIDDSGYFSSEYAEMDGLHFLGKTYDVMLGYIESELS